MNEENEQIDTEYGWDIDISVVGCSGSFLSGLTGSIVGPSIEIGGEGDCSIEIELINPCENQEEKCDALEKEQESKKDIMDGVCQTKCEEATEDWQDVAERHDACREKVNELHDQNACSPLGLFDSLWPF